MSKRTIKCKIVPTLRMSDALTETCTTFAAACNRILMIARETDTSNNIRLHHLSYMIVRTEFHLTANLAVRAIRRVSEAVTAAKKRKKQPGEFRATSVDYDARIFQYRERDEAASLSTVRGRLHVPMQLGDYQRTALAGKRPTAATLVRTGKSWFLHVVVEDGDKPPVMGGGNLGIDLGIRYTAATSNGTLHEGATRQQYKESARKTRASLQSKGTRGSKYVLKRISGKERRRIRHDNHVLSKAIVDEAIRHSCGLIRMERLTHIRQRTRVWNKHSNRMVAGWSFAQLQAFITYKARREGIAVEYVNPRYTSQTCSACGALGTRQQDVFRCTTCGTIQHADINAALNISTGGVVVSRPELGNNSHCYLKSHHL